MQENRQGIRERMRTALPAAMKNGDRPAVAALRSALAAIENAEAVDVTESPSTDPDNSIIAGATRGLGSAEVPRLVLTETSISDIVHNEIADRRETADRYDKLGQTDHAARLRHEADVLAVHLGS